MTIEAAATSAALTVSTVDDQADESPSTVTATVNSGTAYTVSPPGSATVTVTDNDEPPTNTLPTVSLTSVMPNPVTEGQLLRAVLSVNPPPSQRIEGGLIFGGYVCGRYRERGARPENHTVASSGFRPIR